MKILGEFLVVFGASIIWIAGVIFVEIKRLKQRKNAKTKLGG
jgi:hypothetical protein